MVWWWWWWQISYFGIFISWWRDIKSKMNFLSIIYAWATISIKLSHWIEMLYITREKPTRRIVLFLMDIISNNLINGSTSQIIYQEKNSKSVENHKNQLLKWGDFCQEKSTKIRRFGKPVPHASSIMTSIIKIYLSIWI